MNNKLDRTVERMVIFHLEETAVKNCPRCGKRLIKDMGPYQVATFDGLRPADEFAINGDFGYLCAGCETAVIHFPTLAEMLLAAYQRPGWDVGKGCAVIGLINIDAIPPDQRHLSFEDMDPYPLVPFYADEAEEKRLMRESKPRKRRPRKPKRRR